MNNYKYDSADNYYYPESQSNFDYKDSGNAQNRIYEIINSAKNKGLYSPEITNKTSDWPTYYHLTPLRSNILRPFIKQLSAGRTLELGAGCGAITRFIGELGGEVVAIEGSADRARIIGNRCADLGNVTVISDLIQNFKPNEKFDVVTLIGVLEYAQIYIDSPDPIAHLLNIAKSFLKDDGILILAIENQLGLKYFCSSPEDHLGRPMFGVNDSYTKKTAITFGKKELTTLLSKAGFQSIELYIPLPDYKTPVSIIYPKGFETSSINAGWDASPILSGSVVHDRQRPRNPTFSLECAWGVVGRNGLAQDLANSFLFTAQKTFTPINSEILAAHYGSQRPARFSKETQFTLEDKIIITKTRSVCETSKLDSTQWNISPYRTGKLWFDELLILTNRPEWNFKEIIEWTEIWISALRSSPLQPINSTINELRHFSQILPANYIDATPTNLIVKGNGDTYFFDLEWNFSTTLPIEFIVFRGLFLTLHRITSCARPAADVPVKLYDLTIGIMNELKMKIEGDDLDLFLSIFNAFQNQTQDMPNNIMNGLTAELETALLPIRKLFT